MYGEEAVTMKQLAEHLFMFEDTCHVYVLRNGREALLIDFGSGAVMEHLPQIGVERVTDIFMTHHHRDQGQGLPQVQETVRIWVPYNEQDLFAHVNDHWQARVIYNNYQVRQDRFSLLESVRIHGTLKDYSIHSYGPFQIEVVPTPGHTLGSITLLIRSGDQSWACTGDLISHPGKVWSMAATQWTYNGAEGIAATLLSLRELKSRNPGVLLPSHGVVMEDPAGAMDLLAEQLQRVLRVRNQYIRLYSAHEHPYEPVTEHVLWNKTCFAYSYVLLSNSGKALLIDYGYDGFVGSASGFDRAGRRPWLYSLRRLKEQYGVTQIDVVLPTHYHDDHVAGFNLLREAEGTQVWAPANFADVLERPERYDLPCLWFDPIPVDRVLPSGRKISWEEYELTLYEQPGHTLYAVAISFWADGKHFLAIGDQQGDDGYLWNYVYQNLFQIDDYVKSGQLYNELRPDIILSGHWPVVHVEPDYLRQLLERGQELADAHRALLPLAEADMDAPGFCAWIRPYQITANPGDTVNVEVEVLNPLSRDETAEITLVLPSAWNREALRQTVAVPAQGRQTVSFLLSLPEKRTARRDRIAADVSFGARKFGQQAEALVTIRA
jgi:glyoxylase-like metal-dependent hydrolase (beta-lactamase superfamily II)